MSPLFCRLIPPDELWSPGLAALLASFDPYGAYSDPALLQAWWEQFHEGRTSRVVEVSEDGERIAFLPLMIAVQPCFRGLLRLRELRSWVDEPLVSPARAPFLIHPAHISRLGEIVKSAIDFCLAQPGPRIDRVAIGPLVESHGLPSEPLEESEMCVDLVSRRENPLAGVPRKMRDNLRRRMHRLDEQFPGRWKIETGSITPDLADCFIEMKRSTWTAPVPCAFDDPRLQAFLREGFTRAGHARCMVCRIDEKVAGLTLYFLHKNRLVSYNTCYSPEFRQFGIGRVMSLRLIEQYAADYEVYSFGIGDQEYKKYWAGTNRFSCRVGPWRNAPRRMVYRILQRLRATMRPSE